MANINKKYIEDFDQLVRHFEKLKLSPTADNLQRVMQDLHQVHHDLDNMHL